MYKMMSIDVLLFFWRLQNLRY